MKLSISKIDPLLCDFEMPLQATYYPLGFPLSIATNSRQVLVAADESWGRFDPLFAGPPLELRIGVEESGDHECPPIPVCREQRNLLARVADAANFSFSDLENGFAFAWLTSAAVEHMPYLRWHFIEGMTWDLVGSLCVTSVHAACVVRGDSGILLCGDNGAGKSSLSYACARSGWTYVTDDCCSLVRGRDDRMVVANPYQIRFRESATELFPELRQQRRTPHNGEMAIEVPTAELAAIKTASNCSIDHIVFLNRGTANRPMLSPFSKDIALQWFEQLLCCGMGEIRETHRSNLRRLMTADIHELRYEKLSSAVELLETLTTTGSLATTGSAVRREEEHV